MKILTDFKFYVVVATLSFTGLLLNYVNNLDELKKTKEELLKYQTDRGYILSGDIEKSQIINERDSLQGELFVTAIQLTRYETTLELLREEDKKSAERFELIYTTQTE